MTGETHEGNIQSNKEQQAWQYNNDSGREEGNGNTPALPGLSGQAHGGQNVVREVREREEVGMGKIWGKEERSDDSNLPG